MPRKTPDRKESPACTPGDPGCGCRVEAVLGVDERGQMVLPKDVRDRAEIRPGDRMALISWEKEGKVCCLALVKADSLSGMVRGVLGPLLGERE